MRIGGLASGMDIDSIVADLMKAERMPLDKLKQKKQVLEWQRDDYRSMNTLLLDFRSELTQMKLSSKYRARTTTSTDETKNRLLPTLLHPNPLIISQASSN